MLWNAPLYTTDCHLTDTGMEQEVDFDLPYFRSISHG